jgi:hypothetical protein
VLTNKRKREFGSNEIRLFPSSIKRSIFQNIFEALRSF